MWLSLGDRKDRNRCPSIAPKAMRIKQYRCHVGTQKFGSLLSLEIACGSTAAGLASCKPTGENFVFLQSTPVAQPKRFSLRPAPFFPVVHAWDEAADHRPASWCASAACFGWRFGMGQIIVMHTLHLGFISAFVNNSLLNDEVNR